MWLALAIAEWMPIMHDLGSQGFGGGSAWVSQSGGTGPKNDANVSFRPRMGTTCACNAIASQARAMPASCAGRSEGWLMVVTPSERDIWGHDLRVKGKMVNPQPARRATIGR